MWGFFIFATTQPAVATFGIIWISPRGLFSLPLAYLFCNCLDGLARRHSNHRLKRSTPISIEAWNNMNMKVGHLLAGNGPLVNPNSETIWSKATAKKMYDLLHGAKKRADFFVLHIS